MNPAKKHGCDYLSMLESELIKYALDIGSRTSVFVDNAMHDIVNFRIAF